MNDLEKLAAIRAEYTELLELCKKRTPGKWYKATSYQFLHRHHAVFEEGDTPRAIVLTGVVGDPENEESESNAAFVAAASEYFEVTLRTMIAAIDAALECESWDCSIQKSYIRPDAESILNSILVARKGLP